MGLNFDMLTCIDKHYYTAAVSVEKEINVSLFGSKEQVHYM